MNRIIKRSNHRESADFWYEYYFDTDIEHKLFESMICDDDSDSITYMNLQYSMMGDAFRLYDDVCEIITSFIYDHDVKSAILNMNHSDGRIRSVCKFIICSRGVYVIEYEYDYT